MSGANAAAPRSEAATVEGSGLLSLRGDLDIELRAEYPVLLLRDRAGDAATTGLTGGAEFFGYRVYFAFDRVHIAGSDLAIVLIGQRIEAQAEGTGWLFVKGTGTYAVGSSERDWQASGSVAAIGSELASADDDGLTAYGTGVIAARGSLDYQASIGGGVLLVKDVAGDATVDAGGVAGVDFLGFTAYAGASRVRIFGSDVAAVVAGTDVYVTATGSGWAFTQGAGSYSTDSGQSVAWDPSGQFAAIGR